MGEFDKLKDEAEHEAQQHPQQVEEGAQAIEKKLGVQPQGDAQPGQAGQASSNPADSGEQGQNSPAS
jgi:hypothetical protein